LAGQKKARLLSAAAASPVAFKRIDEASPRGVHVKTENPLILNNRIDILTSSSQKRSKLVTEVEV
jgi:hypothetical protein